MTLIFVICFIFVVAAALGMFATLWAVESGYVDIDDSPRNRQLREQLLTLQTAQRLNMQAWQTRQEIQAECNRAHGKPGLS